MQIDFRRRNAALWLLLVSLVLGAQAATAVPLCTQSQLSLADVTTTMRVPPRTRMTPARIRQLPDSRFAPVRANRFLGSTRASWWLRIELHNNGSESCMRWLQIGPNHLHDVRVYVPRD